MSSIKNLLISYKKKQNELVDNYKKKKISDKEYKKAQEEEWFNFLVNRVKIEENKKNKISVINFLSEKTNSLFLEARDDFYSWKITEKEMNEKKLKAFMDFENILYQLNISHTLSTISFLNEFLREAREIENKTIKTRKKINIIKKIKLCKLQLPIAERYYNHFKKYNCGL